MCAFPAGSLGPLDTPPPNPACPELSDNVSVCRVGGGVAWALPGPLSISGNQGLPSEPFCGHRAQENLLISRCQDFWAHLFNI